jgi:23S rRNA (uracil1939-C5)-methyltransferase
VLEVGFSAARTHRLVAIDRCPVLAKSLDGAIDTAWAIAETIGPVRKPLDIQVTASDAGLDIDVRGSGPLPPHLITALARLAGQRDIARVTRHSELIAQLRAPTVRMGKAIVHLPPAAFLQATAEGEAVLARLVVKACDDAANVADLFAGIGPFALRLAEAAHVFAVDDDDVALAALKRAAATTAGLRPLATETRDLFRRPLGVTELKRFDAVVFDPPRQGALSQARELAASGVALVVAVSCNPATFARDASELVRGGYRLTAVTPVDQFRYAAHVEIVACFTK